MYDYNTTFHCGKVRLTLEWIGGRYRVSVYEYRKRKPSHTVTVGLPPCHGDDWEKDTAHAALSFITNGYCDTNSPCGGHGETDLDIEYNQDCSGYRVTRG